MFRPSTCSKKLRTSSLIALGYSCAGGTPWATQLQGLWRDARSSLQACREFGTTAVSVQKSKSHQALDCGRLECDVMGNERADEFARKRAEQHALDKSVVAVHHKLVKRVAKTAAIELALHPASQRDFLLGAKRRSRVHGPRSGVESDPPALFRVVAVFQLFVVRPAGNQL